MTNRALDYNNYAYSHMAVRPPFLVANTNKGLRPSFDSACEPIRAKELFEACLSRLKETIHTETGVFGADMQVQLINDGPVTFML